MLNDPREGEIETGHNERDDDRDEHDECDMDDCRARAWPYDVVEFDANVLEIRDE